MSERHVTHTPGPWRAHTDKADKPQMAYRGNVCVLFMNGLGDDEYAAVSCAAGEVGPELSDADWHLIHKANARLVAAAPDLLAALNALIAFWEGDPMDLDTVTLVRARAAIAKAEGRE